MKKKYKKRLVRAILKQNHNNIFDNFIIYNSEYVKLGGGKLLRETISNMFAGIILGAIDDYIRCEAVWAKKKT